MGAWGFKGRGDNSQDESGCVVIRCLPAIQMGHSDKLSLVGVQRLPALSPDCHGSLSCPMHLWVSDSCRTLSYTHNELGYCLLFICLV